MYIRKINPKKEVLVNDWCDTNRVDPNLLVKTISQNHENVRLLYNMFEFNSTNLSDFLNTKQYEMELDKFFKKSQLNFTITAEEEISSLIAKVYLSRLEDFYFYSRNF